MLKLIKNYIKKEIRNQLDQILGKEEDQRAFQDMVDEAVMEAILHIADPKRNTPDSFGRFRKNDTYKKLQREVAKKVKEYFGYEFNKLSKKKNEQIREATRLTDWKRDIKSNSLSIVEKRVGSEEFLDEIVQRLRSKQLPGDN